MGERTEEPNNNGSTEKPQPAGVMDATYASDRLRKPHLRFRYRTRARVAWEAWNRHAAPRKASRVLEFGAAEGLTLIELHRLFGDTGEFLGIEYSAELLANAPELPDGVRLVRSDVKKLPAEIAGGSYDLVVALALLEHLDTPEGALAEAWRVLAPGGLFVATVPSPAWDRLSTRLGLLRGEHHEVHLDRAALVDLFTSGGYEVLEFRRFMFAPVGFLPYLGLNVPVARALALDRAIGTIPGTRWAFVNQSIVARKP